MDIECGEEVGHARKQSERAGVAGDAHPAGRELVPELVVPEILGQATRQPQPTHVSCGQSLHVAERAERVPERRHAR